MGMGCVAGGIPRIEPSHCCQSSSLKKRFENLTMKTTEKVVDFSTRAQTIVNQLRAYREEVKEQQVVEKILRSLPEIFDPVMIAIEESKDLSNYSIHYLMGSLLSHEHTLERSKPKAVWSKPLK
uniref:Uncharacterized protein n=1 Tax=Nicotiana tabacum TaxID=4097 RepID=A0A1S3ZD11_TOBAC|nr:PREDICTED: uncharacterized protein LOC107785493 [Nicotiana tabacum]